MMAQCVGYLLHPSTTQQAQHPVAQRRQRLRCIPSPHLPAILAHRLVPHVMHLVLYPPMSTPQPFQFLCTCLLHPQTRYSICHFPTDLPGRHLEPLTRPPHHLPCPRPIDIPFQRCCPLQRACFPIAHALSPACCPTADNLPRPLAED